MKTTFITSKKRWGHVLCAVVCGVMLFEPCCGQLFHEADVKDNRHGSALVDAMYVKGLRYLMKTQAEDGSFTGQYGSDPAIAGFCLMSVLAHGDDPNVGPYAPMAKKCLELILKNQNKDTGYISNTSSSSMYTHGFATLALAESYGTIKDNRIGPALKKAVDLILKAQEKNPLKAWRYSPDDTSADTSVAGCQIVALFAARNAGIPVPDQSIEDGLNYLESCRGGSGGYGYTSPSEEGRVTLTSIGVLGQSLNKTKETEDFKVSLAYLKKHINHREEYYAYYLEYYMSQALFQADEEIWKEWNIKNIRYMKASQSPDGSWPGDMSPAYNTSVALLSLALNYRFLPIYEK